MLAKEHIADDSHALAYDWVGPESTQVGDGVNDLLLYLHLEEEVMVIYSVFCEKYLHLLIIPFDETDDPLSKVFRDVLRLVLESSLHPLA